MKKLIPFHILLKHWRRNLALTQREAAARLGVNLRTYQSWEIARYTPRPFVLHVIRQKITSDS